jgi:DNA-binding transcriptional LysR family regulator
MLELERQLTSQQQQLEGSVSVTASEVFSEPIARGLVGLRQIHPGIEGQLIASNQSLDLTKGEADIAVRFFGTSQQGLIVKKVLDLEMGVYASKGYLEVARDPTNPTKGHSLVAFDKKEVSEWPGWQRLDARVVMRSSSLNAVRTAISAGLGIGALPRYFAMQERLELVVPDTVMTVSCSLVVHPDLKDAPRIRAVLDYLGKYLQDSAQQLGGRLPGDARN